jgi:hypothetical protein
MIQRKKKEGKRAKEEKIMPPAGLYRFYNSDTLADA